jgi:hypothetical protein
VSWDKPFDFDYAASYDKQEIELTVNLYIPITYIEVDGVDINDCLPKKIYVVATLYRNAKKFSEPINIQIITDNPCNELSLSFDKSNNNYPKTIKIDEIEYEVNSVESTFKELNTSNIHNIEIENWTSPASKFIISGIQSNLYISNEITRKQIISFASNCIDRDLDTNISYGIISNRGNLSFIDNSGDYKALAENNLLTDEIKIEAFLNNTLTKTRQKIATFNAETWNYDNNNNAVNVSLKDDLEEWQDIQVEGFDYDVRFPTKILPNKNMADLYKLLYAKTPNKYKMISFSSLDANTKDILEKTTIPYPTLKSGSLWSQWTKLCVACGLHIYKNPQGNTICVYKNGA